MPKIKLTKTSIAKLPPVASGFVEYFDTELSGFSLRVGTRGATYYMTRTDADSGKRKRIKIGTTKDFSLPKAREHAQRLATHIRTERLPKTEEPDSPLLQMTLREAFELMVKERGHKLKPRTLVNYRQTFNKHLPDWLEIPVKEITPNMVIERHAAISKTGPVQANKVMDHVSIVINYVANRFVDTEGRPGILYNPVRSLKGIRAKNPERRRRTVVRTKWMPEWFAAIADLPNETYRDYLFFIWQTGARREETAMLPWKQVDLEDRTFWFAEGTTKNDDELRLPMSDFVYNLLRFRKEHYGDSEWVFPSPGKPKSYLVEPYVTLKYARMVYDNHFTLHDLRRTFITACESSGVGYLTMKRLVNHRLTSDVTEGYYVPEVDSLREPVQRVSDYLLKSADVQFLPTYT